MDKKNLIFLIILILVIGGFFYLRSTKKPEFCIQVITPALNPKTGECKNFPTPCDVPEGWKKVKECPSEVLVSGNLSDVKSVVYYWNLHSKPEGLENATKIINDLNPDMIWYSHWITGFPMPANSDEAYRIAVRCGATDEKAMQFKKWCEEEHYTLDYVKEQVNAVKDKIYCPCILGYSNFRTDFNFDPLTFECYSKEDINSMLLNFGKWGIINQKTGKPYTLEETQELFRGLAGEMGVEFRNKGIFDLSSEKLMKYQVDKAIALKNPGVECVWYDLFFQLPQKLSKQFGFEHQMIKDLYEGACDIIDQVKAQGLIVGTWINALEFPYERIPDVDYVTVSPTVGEVLNLKIDYSRWLKFTNLIKEKKPGIPLIIMFDFADRDDLPLAVFSQKLTPAQQSQFLVELNNLAENLTKETGVKVLVAYPVHGPGIGRNPKKLAFGKYKIYDALAPEFDTYETIKELAQSKK